MSLTEKYSTLAADLEAKTAAKLAEEKDKAEAVQAAAVAWDAMVNAQSPEFRAVLPVPHLLVKISGRVVVFMKDVTPDSALALLRACPPAGLYHYRGNGIAGFRKDAAGKRGFDPNETVTPADGVTISASRTDGYPTQTLVEWDAHVHGQDLSMRVEMRRMHGVTPEITGHVAYYNDRQTIARIENQGLNFPLGTLGARIQTYGSGSIKRWNNYVAWGPAGDGAVQRILQAMVDKLDAEGRATLAAYLADKARAEAGTLPEDEPQALAYGVKMNTGTRAQFEALRTRPALIDCALARRHWARYAADYNVETTQEYFDYFAWACAYLKRVGLLRDPGLIVKCNDGKARPYKYGSAWLGSEVEQAKTHAETLAAIEAGTLERAD